MGGWGTVAKDFPVQFLIKEKNTHPGFQVFTFNEGFCMPKTAPNKEEAKKYLNWFIGAENNEEYNKTLNYAPANTKAKGTELSKAMMLSSEEERSKKWHNLDWQHLASIKDQMIQKFEKEVVPLIK